MDLGIRNKHALVTGASRGIGAAVCESLSREGVFVTAVARSEKDLQTLEAVIGSKNNMFIQSDLITDGAIETLYSKLLANDRQPAIIINNVGGTMDLNEPLCSSDDFLRVMKFNLGIAMDINRMMVPNMREKKWGRICHVSSISALENQGPPSYSAAKAALNAYVRGVSRYLASENVILTSVMPGAIFTKGGYWDEVSKNRPDHLKKYLEERMATKRLGQVSEIAELTTFLVSEHASFMVGSSILADGGQGRVFSEYE
jgi:3-oxoacyl-[acyl-carrier protein] reductase